MANIINYLEEVKDFSFEDFSFNQVDSLVLSQLAYLYFNKAYDQDQAFKTTLRDFWKEDFDQGMVQNKTRLGDNQQLLEQAAGGRRFGAITLGYYVNQFEMEEEKQFAAITYCLGPGLYYIAYRGTDGTFVGWKEDFNLTFMEHVPAQKTALGYFEKIAGTTQGRYILGGHSKGGNLSTYAALTAKKDLKEKIVAIFNHDGPGFLPDTFSKQDYSQIEKRVYKTIPQSAVVGLLLHQELPYKVVASDGFAIMQHDPFTWQVENRAFIIVKQTDSFSKVTSQAVSTWLENIDPQTRQMFIDNVYQFFKETNAKNRGELEAAWNENLKTMANQYKQIDGETKKNMYSVVKALDENVNQQIKKLVVEKGKKLLGIPHTLNIETQRCIIRNYKKEDLQALHEIFSNPVVMEACEPVYTLEQTKKALTLFGEKAIAFGAVEKQSQKLIGHLLFKQLPGAEEGIYEIGWIFNQAYWGKGFAYETASALIAYGFNTLNLHKICAETIDPVKSLGLMKKLGMTQEGVFRKHSLNHQKDWVDLHWYGILAEDYARQ